MNLSELDIVFFLCKRPKLVPCLRLSCLIINCILFELKVTTKLLSAWKQDCGLLLVCLFCFFQHELKRVMHITLL